MRADGQHGVAKLLRNRGHGQALEHHPDDLVLRRSETVESNEIGDSVKRTLKRANGKGDELRRLRRSLRGHQQFGDFVSRARKKRAARARATRDSRSKGS